MKKILLLITIGLFIPLRISADAQKVPETISFVIGRVGNIQSVVHTTIFKPEDPDAKPVITRALLGRLTPGTRGTVSVLTDVVLNKPTPPGKINTFGATEVIGKIGGLVGAVGGPKGKIAGAGIQAGAALAQMGVDIAEAKMNEMYENQQYRVDVLEILPDYYYKINDATNLVETTPEFEKDLPKYLEQSDRYLNAFKKYREQEEIRIAWETKLNKIDAAGKRQDLWDKFNAFDKETVLPLLRKRDEEGRTLSEMYPPYRMALMADPATMPTQNSLSCPGSGPWSIYVIYYIGAAQTNRFAVKYCVPDGKKAQHIIVDVTQNHMDVVDEQYQTERFVPGGIQFKGAAEDSNIKFVQNTGEGTAAYSAANSEVLNWFAQMIINPAAEGIEQFMVPFDIYEIRNDVAKKAEKEQNVKTKKTLAALDEAIKLGKEGRAGLDQERKEQRAREENDRNREEGGAGFGGGGGGGGGGGSFGGDGENEGGGSLGGGSVDPSVTAQREEARLARNTESTGAIIGALGQSVAAFTPLMTDDPKKQRNIQLGIQGGTSALQLGNAADTLRQSSNIAKKEDAALLAQQQARLRRLQNSSGQQDDASAEIPENGNADLDHLR